MPRAEPGLSQKAYDAWAAVKQFAIDVQLADNEEAAQHLARATSAIWTARTVLIETETSRLAQGGVA